MGESKRLPVIAYLLILLLYLLLSSFIKTPTILGDEAGYLLNAYHFVAGDSLDYRTFIGYPAPSPRMVGVLIKEESKRYKSRINR